MNVGINGLTNPLTYIKRDKEELTEKKMKNTDWQNDKPSEKQISLFEDLKHQCGYTGTPITKGEYRDAIAELLQLQKDVAKMIKPSGRPYKPLDWMDAYDDNYLGDQGIFPGY